MWRRGDGGVDLDELDARLDAESDVKLDLASCGRGSLIRRWIDGDECDDIDDVAASARCWKNAGCS